MLTMRSVTLLLFIASNTPKDPSTITSLGHRGIEDEEDDQDKFLNAYNELINKHIKL